VISGSRNLSTYLQFAAIICITGILIASLFFKRGYYAQIIAHIMSFVISILADGVESPFTLVFLVMAIVTIYVYHISLGHIFVSAIVASFFLLISFYATIGLAFAMLMYMTIMALALHVLINETGDTHDEKTR